MKRDADAHSIPASFYGKILAPDALLVFTCTSLSFFGRISLFFFFILAFRNAREMLAKAIERREKRGLEMRE